MKILAIDTTTFLGSVALVDGERMVAAMQMDTQVTYSERLVAAVDHLLQGARWQRNDIDLIGVARGPGSFTGLRIGIGTAKGMAVALSRPLMGVSSLEVLARGMRFFDGTVVAVIDARRDEVYSAAYTFDAHAHAHVVMEEHVSPPDVLGKRLHDIPGRVAVIGDGARRYGDLFSAALGDRRIVADDALNFPHAAHCAFMARRLFEERGTDDAAELVPNYVRLSDAEIGFRGRQGA